LHQERKVLVTESNLDDICKINIQLSYSNHTIEKQNAKGEIKEVLQKSYRYWDKEYDSLKKLNKHGVYVMIDIPFETIFDLIPYYPYVIACHYWSKEKEMVILAHDSFVDETIDERLASGWFNEDSISFQWHYKQELAEHTHEVAKELDKNLASRYDVINLHSTQLTKDGEYYLVKTDYPVDYNHKIDWLDASMEKHQHTHWTSPAYRDINTIALNEKDIEGYMKDDIANSNCFVRYVVRNW
jgi:hypothetical protein